MDIEVKNSLDRALMTLAPLEGISGRDTREVLAKDIYCFIYKISTDGADDRFNYFSKVYLGGEYKSEDMKSSEKCDIPESIRAIESNSDANGSVAQIDGKSLVAFFTTLGKSLLSSKADKNDINMDLFLDEIKTMNNHVNDVTDCKLSAEDGKEISKRKETETEAEESTIEPEESLEELLEQLDDLIGLDGVKKEVREIINLIKIRTLPGCYYVFTIFFYHCEIRNIFIVKHLDKFHCCQII